MLTSERTVAAALTVLGTVGGFLYATGKWVGKADGNTKATERLYGGLR